MQNSARLRQVYGWRVGPSDETLQRLETKVETTSSVNNHPTPVHKRNQRSSENISAIPARAPEAVNTSLRPGIFRRLRLGFCLHLYEFQLTRELMIIEYAASFLLTGLRRVWKNTPIVGENIFSDEAYFLMNVYFNK